MKAIDIVATLIRIFGIYLALKFFEYLYTVYYQIFLMHHSSGSGTGNVKITLLLFTAIIIVSSFIFIKFPTTIAKMIYPGDPNAIIKVTSNFYDYTALISITFGIYIFTWAIPDLVHNFLFIFYYKKQSDYLEPQFWESVFNQVVTVVELLIASYLVFGSTSLAKVIRKCRG